MQPRLAEVRQVADELQASAMLRACLLQPLASCAHLQRATALNCIPSRLQLRESSTEVAVGLKALSSAGTRHARERNNRTYNASATAKDLLMPHAQYGSIAYSGWALPMHIACGRIGPSQNYNFTLFTTAVVLKRKRKSLRR